MTSLEEHRFRLRAQEWVEVRSKEEILRTLDRDGKLGGLPFMPEMFQYCGKRFQVWKRAHKTCDTVNLTGGRRMENAVHLENIRCDGRAHGDCQAACLIFWSEAWLKRVPDPGRAGPSSQTRPRGSGTEGKAASNGVAGITEQDVFAAAKQPGRPKEEPTYVCQATELPRFSKLLPWWDVRQYVEDYAAGNTDLQTMARGLFYVLSFKSIRIAGTFGNRFGLPLGLKMVDLYDKVQAKIGGSPFPRKTGEIPAGQKTPACSIDVKVGDLVRIRSHAEILETLDTNNKNRGLYFDGEYVPFCGQTARVRSEVTRIVDEKTGKLVHFKTRAFTLDNVWCQAHYSDRRMFCPRAIYAYWREAWLEPVEASQSRPAVEKMAPSTPAMIEATNGAHRP